MNERPAKLDLRRGALVRWQPAHAPREQRGKLIRPSANDEEWLVRAESGQQYWIHVTRLRPA